MEWGSQLHAISIVRSVVNTFVENLLKDSIRFPEGEELKSVLTDFEHLDSLPQCAGAVDGTFMHIRKPTRYRDSYRCYKQHTAILILAVVDARGVFTYVNSGHPGSVGAAAAFNTSRLYQKLQTRAWLGDNSKLINGARVFPYIVGDSAFALSSTLKCFDGEALLHQHTFNYRLIRMRRVAVRLGAVIFQPIC